MDTAFVIFNNLPPRMVAKELKMDLACPEPCFQAATSAECFAQVKAWTSSQAWSKKMPLSSTIESICQQNMDQKNCEIFADLGILNLFTMASGMLEILQAI
jgi:hypothetical protein